MSETIANYMTPAEARRFYDLTKPAQMPFSSQVDHELADNGIARIDMSLSARDFGQFVTSFEACLQECPSVLQDTYHIVDPRLGNEAGLKRKERIINRTGRQIDDPKSLFHFTESARVRWQDVAATGPAEVREFLSAGFEVQDTLIRTARQHVEDLGEQSHPNLHHAYFPEGLKHTLSFLRIISYDGYAPTGNEGEVAKPHFDLGGVTIQAYADAPGFWAAKDGPKKGERVHYDTAEHEAYLFLGLEHGKLYGDDSYLKPLWHGVDRILPDDTVWVPNRHAVILFLDAPRVDYQKQPTETLPYLAEERKTA